MTTTTNQQSVDTQLRSALNSASSSVRMQTALAAGTYPDPGYVEALIDRCAVEPDFFVRDMLTWSLIRHPDSITVPRLLEETKSEVLQARSQALHTLSKIGDPKGWTAITDELLRDIDDEVARSAWRAAVVLVPTECRSELAAVLSTQLGRGDRQVQLSLSQALVALGDAAMPLLAMAGSHIDERVRAHALATEHLMRNPDDGFETAIFEAKRVAALTGAPQPPDGDDADR